MTPLGLVAVGGVAAGLVAGGVLVGAVAVADAPLALLGCAVLLAGAAPRRAVVGFAAGVGAGAVAVSIRSAVLPTAALWDALALAVVVVLAVSVAAGVRLPASATLVGAAVVFVAGDPGAPLAGVDTARLLPALVAAAWGAAAAGAGLLAGGAFDRVSGSSRARPVERKVAP